MFCRILLISTVGLASSTVLAEDKWRIFTRAESFSYSAANPVTAYIDFLIGPAPDDGELAFSRNSIESGIGYRRFEFSLIHRNDYNLFFTPDAAQFAYLNKNRQTVPLNRVYDVDVWANQYQVTGAKLGFSLPLAKNFDMTFAYSHLYASEAVSGYMGVDENGEGGHISLVERVEGGSTVKALVGQLYADYYYTDDPLFATEVHAPTGQGYAVDLGFIWRITKNLRMEGVIQDLAGEIRWDNMPRTVARANSESFQVAPDGSVAVTPIFSGQETREKFDQELTRRDSLKLSYRLKRFALGYQYDRMSQTMFNRLSIGYYWSDDWGLHLAGEVETGAGELRLAMPVGEMFFILDDINIDYAHTLGFGWNLNFRF